MGLKYVVSSLLQFVTYCFALREKQQQIYIREADFIFTRPLMSFDTKFRFIEQSFVSEYLRVPNGDLSIYSVVIIFLSFTVSSLKR